MHDAITHQALSNPLQEPPFMHWAHGEFLRVRTYRFHVRYGVSLKFYSSLFPDVVSHQVYLYKFLTAALSNAL